MQQRLSFHITTIATCLALVVIMLGAYTRLTNAGLGCPDWPGCYGHMIVANNLTLSQSTKAWTEMIHRYAAMSLSIFIITLFGVAITNRKNNYPVVIPCILIGLLMFQALLGMWTVTLKLHPLVVMAHLLGGFTVVSLLWCHRLQFFNVGNLILNRKIFFAAFIALIILITQIILGVWVSANYAGLSCIGFPFCNGLMPSMHWHEAFNIMNPIGINYQGGILDSPARITIQMVHRLGAFITASYLILFSCYLLLKERSPDIKKPAIFMLFFCFLQICLGILNVILKLPLSVAVMHNFVAALLLLSVVTINYRLIVFRRSP